MHLLPERTTLVGITARPEIMTPRRKSGAKAFDDEHLDMLSHLLDDFLRVPGTSIRFGLDGIVGFIPGIGDVLGGIASSVIIIAAWQRGMPAWTVMRMVSNVAIETVGGALPFVGNLFDIGWKANRRNYKLLTEAAGKPARTQSQNWLALAGICVVLAALMALPTLLLGWVVLHTSHWFHTMWQSR